MRPTRTAANGPAQGMFEMVQRAGGAGHREDVGRVLLVVADDGTDDLRLEAPQLREQRAGRAVDEAAGEDLGLGGTAFALEVAARDLAGRGRLLDVLDGERHEVEALADALVRDRGDEDHGVAVAHDDRAIGLLGHLARLDGEGLPANLDAFFDVHERLRWAFEGFPSEADGVDWSFGAESFVPPNG